KLEDIVVFGKSHGFNDSLKVVKEDNSFTGITNLSKFDYEPFLRTYSLKKAEISSRTDDKATLHLMAGSKSMIKSHLAINSQKYKLLKLSADYDQDTYQTDWQNSNLSIYWLPQIKDHKAILSYYQNNYQLEDGDTKLSGGKIISPDLQIDLSSYGIYDISGKFSYTHSHQEDDWNDTVTQDDYNAELDLNWHKNDLKATVSMDYLIDSYQVQSWLQKENWILEQAGLWLGVDPDIISVSFKYSHNIILGKNLSLLLSNEPYLSKFDRKSFLETNNYLDLSSEFLQEHVPVNHTICWQYERNFTAAISLNSKYIVNQMNYVMPDGWNDVYYEPEYLDNWENVISARLSWKWHDVSFDHQAEYTIYENKINFAPEFAFDNNLKYVYQKLSAELELNYNTGHSDQDDKYLEDVLLINFGLEYQILNNLLLAAKVENIANIDYQEYDLSPKKAAVVLGGFELSF
ncbi:MAG: hypothetical protein RAO94_07600, partial [Candidatus Stygibacter australis]|nr:hypothetical protein [Candidatus Stygibacter australis]